MASAEIVEIPIKIDDKRVGVIKVDSSGKMLIAMIVYVPARDMHLILETLKDLSCSFSIADISARL